MSDECAWQLQVTTKFSHVIRKLPLPSRRLRLRRHRCRYSCLIWTQMMHEIEAPIKIYWNINYSYRVCVSLCFFLLFFAFCVCDLRKSKKWKKILGVINIKNLTNEIFRELISFLLSSSNTQQQHQPNHKSPFVFSFLLFSLLFFILLRLLIWFLLFFSVV